MIYLLQRKENQKTDTAIGSFYYGIGFVEGFVTLSIKEILHDNPFSKYNVTGVSIDI